MNIRRAKLSDVPACCEILADSILGTYFPKDVAFETLSSEAERESLYLAENDEKVVDGFFGYEEHGAFLTFPYLHLLCVRKATRGKGVGTILLDAFEKICLSLPGYPFRVKSFLLVASDNVDAVEFYRSRHYQTIGMIENMFADDDTEILMAKDLGYKPKPRR